MSSTLFSDAEFIRLSNRSENAFCFEMGVPPGVTRCVMEGLSKEAFASELVTAAWNAGMTAFRRKEYQRAFVSYARRNHGNGKVDEVQLRAMEHLAFLDRLLWRAYEVLSCRRRYSGRMGDKSWVCQVHGINRGNDSPCKKGYEDWIGRQSY